GMSYGPQASVLPGDRWHGDPAERDAADDSADRGLVFIAYNASIAEQYEVVQRWVSGGNSTGGCSAHSDPFLGVPEPGQRRYYRFEATAATGPEREPMVFSIALDTGPEVFQQPRPFVSLQWGAYLF